MAKNELLGPGGLLGPLRERESFSKESIITAAEDRKVLKVWAAVRAQRKMTDPLLIAVFTATEFLDSIVYFKENR